MPHKKTVKEIILKPLRNVFLAIQVDEGSEFYAGFERSCEAENISLFVLSPKSQKLNASMEQVNRTDAEEFYEINGCS